MNVNELEKYENELRNKKEKTTKNKNPFETDSKLNFWWKFSKEDLKNIDFKTVVLKKININNILWGLLVIVSIYSYNTWILQKIEEIPTLKANLNIINENIKKQESELSSLEEINLDSSLLQAKEDLISRHFVSEWESLSLEQANSIYQIARKVWLEIDSLQKIEVKRDDRKIEDFWVVLEDKMINNFYENSWYNKFIISTMSSEEVVLRFKEKMEDEVEFLFDGFTLNQSDWELKYSFSIKALYNLNNNIEYE